MLGWVSVPYLFHTRSRPNKDLAILTLYHCGNQQASVIVPHPPDQVCDPDCPDPTVEERALRARGFDQ